MLGSPPYLSCYCSLLYCPLSLQLSYPLSWRTNVMHPWRVCPGLALLHAMHQPLTQHHREQHLWKHHLRYCHHQIQRPWPLLPLHPKHRHLALFQLTPLLRHLFHTLLHHRLLHRSRTRSTSILTPLLILVILNASYIRSSLRFTPGPTMTAASTLKRFQPQVFLDVVTPNTSSMDYPAIGTGRVTQRTIGAISLISPWPMDTILTHRLILCRHLHRIPPRLLRTLPNWLVNWKTHGRPLWHRVSCNKGPTYWTIWVSSTLFAPLGKEINQTNLHPNDVPLSAPELNVVSKLYSDLTIRDMHVFRKSTLPRQGVCVKHLQRCKTSLSIFCFIVIRNPIFQLNHAGGGCMVWQSSTNEDTAFPWWYDKGTPLSRTCVFSDIARG